MKSNEAGHPVISEIIKHFNLLNKRLICEERIEVKRKESEFNFEECQGLVEITLNPSVLNDIITGEDNVQITKAK